MMIRQPRSLACDELAALAADGKIRLGKGAIEDSFWKLPGPLIRPEILTQALNKERDED